MEAALSAAPLEDGPHLRSSGDASQQQQQQEWKKLLQGVPKFTHYRRRKTNKAPRKRTFIMHMTKTPELLSRTLGVQRAAGGGGGGGKKRHRTTLTGSDSANGGGPNSGPAEKSQGGSNGAAPPSPVYLSNEQHAAAGMGDVVTPLSLGPAPIRSPFSVFAAAQTVAAEITFTAWKTPFASAFALVPVDCIPVVDPLAEDFAVPSKYGAVTDSSISDSASHFVSGKAALASINDSFSDCDELQPVSKRVRLEAPEPSQQGPSISYEAVIASGVYGRVWRGSLEGAVVAVKVPLARFPPNASNVSLSCSASSNSNLPATLLSLGSNAAPASPAAFNSDCAALSHACSYASTHVSLGAEDNEVAVDEDGLSHSDIMAAFANEVIALQAAGPHPNIVRALSAKPHGADAHLVLELAPWGSLSDYLQNSERDWTDLEGLVLAKLASSLGLPADEATIAALEQAAETSLSTSGAPAPMTGRRYLVALALLVQAARGTAHLHASGLVHRDLKPENILIGADGAARVADLGLSRRIPSSSSERAAPQDSASSTTNVPAMTVSEPLPATPQYASPEDLRGDHAMVSERSDSYSLGYCLWQALSGGEVPWQGLLPATVMYRVCYQGATPAVSALWPTTVRSLLAAAWQPQPSERPSASEFAAALEAELARLGGSAL